LPVTLQIILAWSAFIALVAALLGFDLLILHRKPHAISVREAIIGSALPVVTALLFAGAIYAAYQTHFLHLGTGFDPDDRYRPDTGGEAVTSYLTGYLIELTLSADNVFLFVLLIRHFRVPVELQHRVLFYGVLGALVLRGGMILGAGALLDLFHPLIYLFGAFLIFTGIKMLLTRNAPPPDPGNALPVRMARRVFSVHEGFVGSKFFIRIAGRRFATTLWIVLLCVEFTDVLFAVDSIPAIFGITHDSFLVFTSNVFAILGLRSMYFLLANLVDRFHYLTIGLAAVLTFVGLKMVLPLLGKGYGSLIGRAQDWEIPKGIALGMILTLLAASVISSMLLPPPNRKSHS
jgi:tellurite resistance protein TerC